MRTLLLVPLLVGLLFMAVAELGHPAAGKVRRSGIIAALEDPLSLFADRSPGGRGSGPLLSTKPGLGPEERVLSQVREREAPLGDPPAAGDPLSPVTPEDIAALPNGLPGSGDPPGAGGDPGFGPAFFSPSFPNALSDPPTIPGGGGPPGSSPPGLSDPLPPTLPGVAAVPEPATWAMMILGFFGVGVALRRRARQRGSVCAPQS